MKKLTILLFSIFISFNSYGEWTKISETVLGDTFYIEQDSPKGLGHAISCATEFVGDNSFAVLLGDTICVGKPNCTKGLVDIFNHKKKSVFAVENIKLEDTKKYGVISGVLSISPPDCIQGVLSEGNQFGNPLPLLRR